MRRGLTIQLVTLPRNPNVRQLLEDYRIHVNSTKKSQDRTPYVPFPFPLQHQYQKATRDANIRRATALLSEIIAGITLYFDKALGNNLLYRFERAQYVEQKRENPDKPMSEIYGAEHLLRLFGEFCSEVLIPSSESWIDHAMKTWELMNSQLWTFYRLYQYRPRITQHIERVHQWYHEVSEYSSLPAQTSHSFLVHFFA